MNQEEAAARSLLDQLLTDSRLYTRSEDYQALLKFVSRLRNFAPFNAMLLHLQKPGLSYAASAQDWWVRFERKPKHGARPLLILWPFGPVALVYDVLDTEGKSLPEDVASFVAHGPVDEAKLLTFVALLAQKRMEVIWLDAGDRSAGSIAVVTRAGDPKQHRSYRICINRSHTPPVQFATLVHELGHLFLGHLGQDSSLKIPSRPILNAKQKEIEAESVAYLLCERNGVQSKSSAYLSQYVASNTTVADIDLYQVMRAAGQIESLLGITASTKFDKPKPALASIAILAYGSLIGHPGSEIIRALAKRIVTTTPFPVEYARLSGTRGGGPTVAPHRSGHAVSAELLVLAEWVSLGEAKDMLWRRETGREGSGSKYSEGAGPNAVVIRDVSGYGGCSHVLYTDFHPEGKLVEPDSIGLAGAAIRSVARAQNGQDAIAYLIDLLDRGVETPLTRDYVSQILASTGATRLSDARTGLREARNQTADSR